MLARISFPRRVVGYLCDQIHFYIAHFANFSCAQILSILMLYIFKLSTLSTLFQLSIEFNSYETPEIKMAKQFYLSRVVLNAVNLELFFKKTCWSPCQAFITCSVLLAKFCVHYTVSNLYFYLARFFTHYIRRFKLHRKPSLPLPSDVKDHRLFELGILESIIAIKLCYSLVSHFQIIDINDLSQSILRELSIPHQEWNLTILGHEFVNNQLPLHITH